MMITDVTKCYVIIAWTINEPHLPYKTGLDVMESHENGRDATGMECNYVDKYSFFQS